MTETDPIEIAARGIADVDDYPGTPDPQYYQYARAVIAALEAAGYKVMAREPTKEMDSAQEPGSPFWIFGDMFDAAPVWGKR
jgi:hypothetical protein